MKINYVPSKRHMIALLLYRRKSNRLFRNKPNNKMPQLAVSVRENPRKTKLDGNGKVRIRVRFVRGPHI